MRKLSIAVSVVVALFATTPVHAAETINRMAHISACIHSDRLPRTWKTLYLIPGKIQYWQYEWIMEDGSVVIQVLTYPLKHVPDRRPFSDSHPNMAIIMPAAVNGGGNMIGGFVGNKL
jgi:hypothetical protein